MHRTGARLYIHPYLFFYENRVAWSSGVCSARDFYTQGFAVYGTQDSLAYTATCANIFNLRTSCLFLWCRVSCHSIYADFCPMIKIFSQPGILLSLCC